MAMLVMVFCVLFCVVRWCWKVDRASTAPAATPLQSSDCDVSQGFALHDQLLDVGVRKLSLFLNTRISRVMLVTIRKFPS